MAVYGANPAAFTAGTWGTQPMWLNPGTFAKPGDNTYNDPQFRFLDGNTGQWTTLDKLTRNDKGEVYVIAGKHNGEDGSYMPVIAQSTRLWNPGEGQTEADAPWYATTWGDAKILDTPAFLDADYNRSANRGMAVAGAVFGAGAVAAGAGAGAGAAGASEAGASYGAGDAAITSGGLGTGGTAAAGAGATAAGTTAVGTTAAGAGAAGAGRSILSMFTDAAGNVDWGAIASAGLLTAAYAETGDAPKVDTTALTDNAKATQAMAQDQYQWSRGEYDNTLKPAAQEQADRNRTNQDRLDALSDESAKAAANQQYVYDTSYTPVNQRLADEALRFNSDDYANKLSAAAQASVRSKYAQADQEVQQRLAERGNSMSGNMAASMAQKSALASAAQQASADYTSRTEADKVGFDRLGVAAQQGNAIASQATGNREAAASDRVASSQVGAQTVNNFVNAVGTANSGAGTALTGMNAAGSQLSTAAGMQYQGNRDAYQDRLSILGLGAGLLGGGTKKSTKSTTFGAV